MGLNFEFATATKIIFGSGSSKKLPLLLQGIKGRVLVVTGKSIERYQPVVELLQNEGYKIDNYTIDKEPTVQMVSEGARLARDINCAAVVGLGGGSVIDAAKAKIGRAHV